MVDDPDLEDGMTGLWWLAQAFLNPSGKIISDGGGRMAAAFARRG
jgi:hypothetical protein